jgi:hypothetical protein
VTALVSVQIRLATPISDGPKLIGYPPPIRRAYRPWRKPWRSGFDSRHGVPPFDHATCPLIRCSSKYSRAFLMLYFVFAVTTHRTLHGLSVHLVYQIHHSRISLCSTMSMSTTAILKPGNHMWGIYYTDREYAREMGDPLRTVIEAPTKLAAEKAAARLGFGEPWAHPITAAGAQRAQCLPKERQIRCAGRGSPGKPHGESIFDMQTPSTAQIRTAIEVLKKFGEHINHNAANLVVQLPDTHFGEHRRRTSRSPKNRASQPHSNPHYATGKLARPIAPREEAMCFSSCLRQGTRYPFVPKDSTSAKQSR